METGLQPGKQQFLDHIASVKAMFSLYVALTPFAGKISMFGALFARYDVYGMIGLGGLILGNTFGTDSAEEDPAGGQCPSGDPNRCDPQNAGVRIGGMFGVGSHLFFNQWFGLNIELRDYLAASNPAGLDVDGNRVLNASDETLGNNLFVSVGVTIMLPPTAKISP